MASEDYPPAVVIDCGSSLSKAGFAGDDAPRVIVPTIVGRSRVQGHEKTVTVGQDVLFKPGVFRKYPIEHGVVTNWEDMEHVWQHIFSNELKVDPEEHAVLVTETVMNPKMNREKVVQIMFEKFNVPALFLQNHAVLSVLASGRDTGIVYESGRSVCHVVTVYEGHSLPYHTHKAFVSGSDIDYYLMKMLTERGYSFTTTAELYQVRDIKEALCYVAQDYDKELYDSSWSYTCEKKYELPDGQTVVLGNERFRAPEAIFRPPLIDQEYPGAHEIISNAIGRCDPDIRNVLRSNILLSGGNTMFQGLAERMEKEISDLGTDSSKAKVIAPPERKLSSWIGGSIFASQSEFPKQCITKDEYDEHGPSLVHRKCF